MYQHLIMGKPKRCLNRNCNQKFFKESCLGFLPKCETEIYCIMRCAKCNDTFAIAQVMSMVDEYIKGLPARPMPPRTAAPVISVEEIQEIRDRMDKENPLALLDKKPED